MPNILDINLPGLVKSEGSFPINRAPCQMIRQKKSAISSKKLKQFQFLSVIARENYGKFEQQ